LEFYAVLSEVVYPGKDQHHREADKCDDYDSLHNPLGTIEGWYQDTRNLNKDPGDSDVKSARTKNFATPQFSNESFHAGGG